MEMVWQNLNLAISYFSNFAIIIYFFVAAAVSYIDKNKKEVPGIVSLPPNGWFY